MSLQLRNTHREEILALATVLLEERYKVFVSHPSADHYVRLDFAMLVFQQARDVQGAKVGKEMSFVAFLTWCQELTGETS